jgi:hypothetical protein
LYKSNFIKVDSYQSANLLQVAALASSNGFISNSIQIKDTAFFKTKIADAGEDQKDPIQVLKK